MHRVEVNVQTGEQRIVELPDEQEIPIPDSEAEPEADHP